MNLEHLVQKERKLLTTAALAKGWKENWKIKKNHCDWLKYINYKKILVHTDTLKIVMGNCYGTNLLLWKLIKVQNQAVTLCFLYELCSEKNSWWGKLFFIVYIYIFYFETILNLPKMSIIVQQTGHLRVSCQVDVLSPLNTEYLKYFRFPINEDTLLDDCNPVIKIRKLALMSTCPNNILYSKRVMFRITCCT